MRDLAIKRSIETVDDWPGLTGGRRAPDRCEICACSLVTVPPIATQHSVLRGWRWDLAYTCGAWYCRGRVQLKPVLDTLAWMGELAAAPVHVDAVTELRHRFHLPPLT